MFSTNATGLCECLEIVIYGDVVTEITRQKTSCVGIFEGVGKLITRMIEEKNAALLFVSKGLLGQKPDRT